MAKVLGLTTDLFFFETGTFLGSMRSRPCYGAIPASEEGSHLEGSDNATSAADRRTIATESGGNADGNATVRRFRRQRSLSNKGVHQAIGLALRAHFDDITKTPMPDTLLALLAELEAKERRDEAKAASNGVGAAVQGGVS